MEVSFDTLAEAMYIAPFACLAHNKFEEGVEDPVFTYANRAALELFEGTWDTMIGMPSRNSAEAAAQEVRHNEQACEDWWYMLTVRVAWHATNGWWIPISRQAHQL
jgi:hypothetical protein